MRVFLGCPIPPDFACHISSWALQTFDANVVRVIPETNLHVTIAFFGEVDAKRVEELAALTRSVVWKPRLVEITGIQLYGRNAIALDLKGLFDEPFDDALKTLWYRQPEAQRHRDPKPHVTVARLRPGAGAPEMPEPPHLAFTLDRLVLYQSLLRSEGASYRELAEATSPASP